MPRALLVLAVVFVVVYLLVLAAQRRGGGGSRPRLKGPVAPDDDPQFLRDLDDKLWRDRLRRRRAEREDPDGHDETGAA